MIHTHVVRRNWRALLVTAVALAAIVSGCGGSSDDERPTVVVTTSVWADVVESVAGDAVTIEVLVPRGVDAHSYRPSSRQAASLQTADLVVANGLGLEEGLEAVLEAASDEGVAVLELAPLLNPVALPDTDDVLDPHVWLDPQRVADAAALIGEALSDAFPGQTWSDRVDAYSAELLEADEAASALLAPLPDASRAIVTNHEALGYFADRYGLTVVGVVIPGGSSLAEPSSSELRDLVATMRDLGITSIFADTTSPSVLADAVAAELGTDVDVIDLYTESLGEPGTGAESVAGMIVENARRISEAQS